MNLFNIAFKNIKRNFYNYFLYFTSMVFSIMIYFTFTSTQYNRQVVELTKDSLKLDTSFKTCAIIIAIFSTVFIWYSNSFFTKRRKKEVALYCMLGVKKKQVARMLFYENLVMGTIALLTGIVIGSLFSKLFIMILVHIMGFNVKIGFAISLKAIINTLIVFLILFIITSLHGYSLIYRFQLIELFKSEKTSQKQPKASPLFAVLALLLIGSGYYFAYTFKYNNLLLIFVILFLTVAGTYFLFSSLIVFIIKFSKRNKSNYYKNLNMINTSQLLYRIKSHSRTLATIAVLSATTITAMGTAACLYYDQVSSISTMAPFSYVYYNKTKDLGLDRKVDNTITNYKNNQITDSFYINFLEVSVKTPNINRLSQTYNKKPYINNVEAIVCESDFKKIMKHQGIKENFDFDPKEVYLFMNSYFESMMDNPKNKVVYFNIKNNELPMKISNFRAYMPINRIALKNSKMFEMLVVKDELYNKLKTNDNVSRVRIINIKNAKESKELTTDIRRIVLENNTKVGYYSPFSSYYANYFDTMSRFGMTIFLATFVGLVFLICTGSIIFFKQLSEANEDKSSYHIIKKLGVSSALIKTSIAKQMLFIFGLPLLVGLSHSFAALSMLRPMLTSNIIIPIILTMGVYSIIYLFYYILTVKSYYKIINTEL